MDEQIIERKKTAIRKVIDQLRPQLVDLAARIHERPETNFEEIKASLWLSEAAREAGFKVEKPVGGLDTAFRATYGDRGEDGPTVAFLAEYDALPKIGHGCGHNLIGAASLGSALGLAREIGDLPGRIQLIGTPDLNIGSADLAGHSTEFVEAANSEKGKEAMHAAAKAMAATALEILVRPSLVEELYREFRGIRQYKRRGNGGHR